MDVETYHFEVINIDKQTKEIDKSRLDQCIESIIQREGYISCDVQKKFISTDGGNYLGVLYEVNVQGKTVNEDKEMSLFIKVMAPDAKEIGFVSIDNVYEREIFFYNELSAVFKELQDEAKVPVNERFEVVKSYEESYSKAIILENVTKQGFKTVYRMDCITLDMAELSIKQLARLHGLSFVIEDRRPDFFENPIKNLYYPIMYENNKWNKYITKLTRTTLKYLDEDTRKKVEDQVNATLEKYSQNKSEDSKRCICHGDYRPNNIMVKEENGKTIEVLPVDYQFIHYGCPILDIIYFIYSGTDYEFRKEHFNHLKDLYYKTLDKYLRYFNIDVELVYPREQFEKEMLEKRDYGIMTAVSVLPIVFALEGDAPDLSKTAVENMEFILDERFKDRFRGHIREFIELGIL